MEARVPAERQRGERVGEPPADLRRVGVLDRDPQLRGRLLVGRRIRELLTEAADLEVRVFPLPNLRAVNVVVVGLLGEGVAASTRPDPQAKGLGEYLRSRTAGIPSRLLAP